MAHKALMAHTFFFEKAHRKLTHHARGRKINQLEHLEHLEHLR